MSQLGATYYFDPNESNTPHLYFVIAIYEAELDGTRWAILVNASTPRRGDDQTCIVGPQDHPFFHHPSVIKYDLAIEREVSKLGALADYRREDASAEVLHRIQRQAHRSPQTGRRHKKVIPNPPAHPVTDAEVVEA